jgi:hypothetical protein
VGVRPERVWFAIPIARGGAIIASQDALFGMARMFEVFAENYFGATRVFRSMDDGTRWLELPPVVR